MPPKKDYSHGPPPQSRPPPNRQGEPRPPEQSLATAPAASRQPEAAQRIPHAWQATVRPPTEENQPLHQEGRHKEKVVPATAPSSVTFPGASSVAAGGTQAAENDGFVAPKKKRRTKSAARRDRDRERRREKRRGVATSMRIVSDGEGPQGDEADESSTGSEQGSRSLSPSLRLGLGFGPLAMVVHENNMFGALQDFPSDEDAPDADERQNSMMTDVFPRKIHFTEPAVQFIGHTSPPTEGTSKRARLSASETC